MGKKTKDEVIACVIEYSKKCQELEEKYEVCFELWDTMLRIDDSSIDLDELANCDDPSEAIEFDADCCLAELVGDDYCEGAILCGGNSYEALYYYQGFGDTSFWGKKATKIIYDELTRVLQKHGFQLDLSRGGTILLQSRDSLLEQLKVNGWNV